MDQIGRPYPSDLTNQQWELIKDLVPQARFGGRPRKTCSRKVINAIFYVIRAGCAWRYLPKDYPPWPTVYGYFYRWKVDGTWRLIHLYLAKQSRINQIRNPTPSTVIIDAQSVRAQYGEERGWDGFKKVRGRKRQILVDTQGILWGVKVHAANQAEQKRGIEAIFDYPLGYKIPERVVGDFSYSKPPFDVEVFRHWNIWPEIRKGVQSTVKTKAGRSKKVIKIDNLKPQRWKVERTFAWFNNFRRLNRDYEKKTSNSEILLFISQIPLLLNRITQPP